MTARANVERVLSHYNWLDAIEITDEERDRVWGWPKRWEVIAEIMLNWPRDFTFVSRAFHGTPFAYREPGNVTPALQIALHRDPQKRLGPCWVEMDIDLHRGVQHVGGEVIPNHVTGAKTDQAEVARELDKRYGKERICRGA